jgi:hypothetical protein
MSREEELVRAFREGRLTRRAFVRQLVVGGMEMPAALAYAEVLLPAPKEETGGAAAATRTASATAPAVPERPVQVDDLETNFVGDGYVVYHPAQDRMHSLNHTAAVVLELCTGANDQSEIARLLQDVYELPEPPEEDIRLCLETLFDEGLIH